MDADLAPFKRAIESLRTKNPTVTVEVTADIDRTSFTRAEAAGGKLGGREEVKVSADVNTSSFAKARAATATLTKESSKMSDVFSRSQLSIGQQTAALSALLPVLVDVGGAAGALTASLGAATAGIGALTVGAGATGAVGLAGIASIAAPAVKSLKDLKTAQDAYTLAVQQYGKHSTQARTAFSKLQVEQKKAGPEAAKFAGTLSAISRRFKDLTQAGKGNFFGALNDGLDRLNQRLPLFAKSANSSMKALRDGFDGFLNRATGPEFDKFVRTMTVTFARSVGPVAKAFGNIALVLERIAVAVAPDVVRAFRGFEEMTKGWVKSTRNASKLHDTIHGLVNQTNTWWKLIKATADLIVTALVPGMGQGQKAVKGITATIKDWTKWVDAHPQAIRDFFKEGLKTTGELAQVLVGFIPQLLQIATAMRPISRAFLGITKALNTIKIGNVSALTVLLGVFVAGGLVRKLVGVASAFKSIAVAMGLMEAASGAGAAVSGVAGAAAGTAGARTATGRIIGSSAGVAGAEAAGGAGLGGVALTAGAIAIPVTAVVAATFTSGGFLDTLKGKGFNKIGPELGKEMGDGLTEAFKETTKNLGGDTIQTLRGKLQAARRAGKDIGKAEALGITSSEADILLHQQADAKATLRDRIKALNFGAQFSRAIFQARNPVKAATGKLMGDFLKLNNESRETFFKQVHQYVTSLEQTGQISKSQGRKIEAYWKGVRQREANRWDKFAKQISTAFKGVANDIQKFIQKAGLGTRKQSRRTLRKGAGDLGSFLGGLGGQHGGWVTGEGVQRIPGFARGGQVPGSTDRVPALLTPGEFVLSKDMLKRLKQGDNLALDKKIVTETRKRAKDTAEGLTDELSKGHKKAKDDTKKFTGDHDNLMNVMRQASNNDIDNLAQHTIQGFQKTHQEAVQQSGSMKKGVVSDFQSMVSAAGQAINKLADMTNKALKALGVKPVAFGVSDSGGGKKPGGKQTGGMVVPGSGPGDKVHLQAMVEPGERVFVLNRNASSALSNLQAMNSQVPRFQQGGIIDRTGIPHFAKGGGMSAMIAEVDKFEAQHFPYVAGGGHGGFGVQPVDCSGFVSDILHVAGLLNAPMTTLGLANWGKKGKGPLTVWNRATGGPGNGHVVIELNGRVAGTSGSNPGGGAGWIAGATGPELVYSAVPRTMDVKGGAMVGAIKDVILKGAKGPLLDMAQAGVDKVHAAANRYLAKKSPSGSFGGGQVAGDLPPSLEKYNHTWHGGTMPFNKVAELAEWAGGGGVPGKTMAQIAMGESTLQPGVVSPDNGYGLWQITIPFGDGPIHQAGFNGYNDMLNPIANAKVMAIMYKANPGAAIGPTWHATSFVTGSNTHYRGPMKQKGGEVPYLGKFHQGGVVPFDGMGMLQGGEVVLPNLKKGGEVIGSGLGGGGGITPAEIFSLLHLGDKSIKGQLRTLKSVLKDADKSIQPQIKLLIAEAKELKQEEKALRLELKEHHRLRAATRANEAAALRAVTNLVGSQIGYQSAQKRRLAAGSTRSY